jgi:hypothetical protein
VFSGLNCLKFPANLAKIAGSFSLAGNPCVAGSISGIGQGSSFNLHALVHGIRQEVQSYVMLRIDTLNAENAK